MMGITLVDKISGRNSIGCNIGTLVAQVLVQNCEICITRDNAVSALAEVTLLKR